MVITSTKVLTQLNCFFTDKSKTMKNNFRHWLLTCVVLLTNLAPAYTQVTITPGSNLIIAGGTMTSLQNVSIANLGTLQVTGTLNLKKDLINQNTLNGSLGSGTILISGGIPQVINGSNIFGNMTISNPAGVSAPDGIRVNGVLYLGSGLVTLGSGLMYLGPSATIGGTPSAASMIVTAGTGELRKEFTGYETFTFPVGDATGTAEYSPVTLTYSNGGFPAGNFASVRVVNAKYPDPGIAGNYLNRYWVLGVSGLESGTMAAVFSYVPADVTGNEVLLQCSRVNPQPWNTFGLANPVQHTLQAQGIWQYGSFTGVKSTAPPATQELTNIAIGSGITTCYDAISNLNLAGNGSTFVVNNGGSVSLVAGQKISIFPGTRVFSGGYLHAWITTNGSYCGSMAKSLVDAGDSEEPTLPGSISDDLPAVKVYPNPTMADLKVDLLRVDAGIPVIVDLYGLNGSHLYGHTTVGGVVETLPTGSLPAGFYVVHVRFAGRSGVFKVVKH